MDRRSKIRMIVLIVLLVAVSALAIYINFVPHCPDGSFPILTHYYEEPSHTFYSCDVKMVMVGNNQVRIP